METKHHSWMTTTSPSFRSPARSSKIALVASFGNVNSSRDTSNSQNFLAVFTSFIGVFAFSKGARSASCGKIERLAKSMLSRSPTSINWKNFFPSSFCRAETSEGASLSSWTRSTRRSRGRVLPSFRTSLNRSNPEILGRPWALDLRATK